MSRLPVPVSRFPEPVPAPLLSRLSPPLSTPNGVTPQRLVTSSNVTPFPSEVVFAAKIDGAW